MSEAFGGKPWIANRGKFDRNLAVVIGIDRYQNASIKDLSTAVRDAREIANLLEQEYGYQQTGKNQTVLSLYDEQATLTALQNLFATRISEEMNPGEGDRLIIYFAGHGLARSRSANSDVYGPEGYLVPYDADPAQQDSFLAMSSVSKALEQLQCHHLLVILDCCFAGTFRWAGTRKLIPRLPEPIHQEHYYHFIRYPSWQVITSSAHDQEALDVARLQEDNRQAATTQADSRLTQEPHSPFALALLEGLYPGEGTQALKADLFPDGVVTAHELITYLQTRVPQLSGQQQQAPGLYPLRRDFDRGEFIFTPPEFDPEVRLAKALPLNEANNPYRGLKTFDEKHAGFFFGRRLLIKELVQRLARPKQVLTVMLGVSGSGKSSLVKAGFIPALRTQKPDQQRDRWRILDPMRPGESPFMSLARAILPIVNEEVLAGLDQVSFLDGLFETVLKSRSEAQPISVAQEQQSHPDETLMKVAEAWGSATPEARLLLIEDYFSQLERLGDAEQQGRLKALHNQISTQVKSICGQLQGQTEYLSRVITTWSQTHSGVQLLLVIDQFEELLTRSQDDGNRGKQAEQADVGEVNAQKQWQQFLEVLKVAIADQLQTDQSEILRLVLTLRSDFAPRFLSSPLEGYWQDACFPVPAMNADELREAIEKPALKQALYFEELKDDKGNTTGNLVSKLVEEVGQMPGALPLLSFTLSELYVRLYGRWQKDQSTDRTLRFEDYEALGGVAGALTRRATEEYNRLIQEKDPNDALLGGFGKEEGKAYQATMQRVMLRMVAIEGGGVARRQVPELELEYADQQEEERVREVINRLVNARLLVTGQEAGVPYVEIAHDFLVRGWDQLQTWIEDEKDEITLQRRLTPAANEWDSRKKQEVGRKGIRIIWRKIESAIIQKFQERQYYRERRKQQETVAKRKEENSTSYLWDEDPRLEQLKQVLIRNKWLNHTEDRFVRESLVEKQRNYYRWIIAVTGVFLGLSGLTITAVYQAKLSNLREQVAVSKNLESINPPEALVLATQALDEASKPFFKSVHSSAESSLFSALEASRELNILKGHEGAVTSLAFSPSNQVILSGGQDGTIRLWDLQQKTPITSNILGSHEGGVTALAFSPTDGHTFVSGGEDGAVKIWNLQGHSQTLGSHQGGVTALAFSPTDSNTFVSAGRDGIIRLWQIDGASKILGNIGNVTKDWRRVILAAAFSPDGKFVATGGSGSLLRLWDVTKQSTPKELSFNTDIDKESQDNGGIGCITSIAFSKNSFRDYKIIASRASASELDGETLAIWDSWQYSKPEVKQITAHEFSSYAVAYDPHSNIFVSGGDDGSLELHDLRSGNLVALPLLGHAKIGKFGAQCGHFYDYKSVHGDKVYGSVTSVIFSPNSQLIASGGGDGTVRIWSADAYPGIKSMQVDTWDNVYSYFYEDLKTPLKIFGSKHSSLNINLSKDKIVLEQIKYTSDFDNRIRKFYSNDGKAIAVVRQNYIQVVSRTGKQLAKQFEYQEKIKDIALSTSSKTIAVVNNRNEIEIRDYAGNKFSNPFLHEGDVHAISLSPDGQTIATARSIGAAESGPKKVTIRLQDLQGNLIAKFNQTEALYNGLYLLAFSPTGRSIISYSYTTHPSIKILPGDSQALLDIACDRLQNHPIVNPPSEDLSKKVKTICRKY